MVNFTAFISYVFVVTFTPGPNNIMSMVSSGKSGYKKTLPFILGVMSGFFSLVLLSSYFSEFLYRVIPEIQWAMKLMGSLYMVYLATKILGIDLKRIIGKRSTKMEVQVLYGFKSGIILQFINPKAIIYAITVVSGFIAPYYSGTLEYLFFSIFLAFMAFLSNTSWALFGKLFNRFLSKHEFEFNIVMALLLAYSAYALWQ